MRYLKMSSRSRPDIHLEILTSSCDNDILPYLALHCHAKQMEF